MRTELSEFLKSKFADSLTEQELFRDQQSFVVKPDSIVTVCEALLNDEKLEVKFLADITCVDWLGHEQEKQGRFEVVYNLYSYKHSYRFFLKVRLDGESPCVRTLTGLWKGANWLEREVFDLFGIKFEGHPNLTKIVTPDELEGHPLRKDFPLTWEQPVFSWNKDDPPEVRNER